jgi:hypothetical protein
MLTCISIFIIAIIVFSQGISAVRPGLVVICAAMPLPDAAPKVYSRYIHLWLQQMAALALCQQVWCCNNFIMKKGIGRSCQSLTKRKTLFLIHEIKL